MDEQKPEPRTRKRWSIPPGTRRPTLGRSPELQKVYDELGFKEVKGNPNEGQVLIFENPKRKVWPKKPGAPPPPPPKKQESGQRQEEKPKPESSEEAQKAQAQRPESPQPKQVPPAKMGSHVSADHDSPVPGEPGSFEFERAQERALRDLENWIGGDRKE